MSDQVKGAPQSGAACNEAGCENGRVYLSEEDLLGELESIQGTGQSISFSFGFGGPERTWRPCPACSGKLDAIDTEGVHHG